MSKVTLDRDTFKVLASDTRLDILRALDGKKLSLKDISKATNLNKATLHEHLAKLHEAGLVKKKERDGHKWVFYKLSWKGESLLHPENTKIVVLFSTTFFALFLGIVQFINFAKGKVVGIAQTVGDETQIFATGPSESLLAYDEVCKNATNTTCLPELGDFVQVSQIPPQNYTVGIDQLSQSLNENASIKGLAGNTFADNDISWSALDLSRSTNGVFGSAPGSEEVADGAGNIGSQVPTMVASVQDPTFLYIGIFCLIVFSVLISIALWRLWKNSTPKL